MAQSYVSYVHRHYYTVTIVFDGCKNHFSAKKNAYTKRNPVRCQDVVNNASNIFCSTQEKFLSNENNKLSIIILISKYLEEDSEVAIQCDGNANPTFTSAVISLSSPKTDNPVMVVAHDTDIAVMLLHVF